jgi:hypothetical protein
MTSGDARWEVSPDVRATYSDDGAVLLDIEKGLCYSLNVVGSRIWVTIESRPKIRLEEIVDALETDFTVPREQLRADAAQYLSNLFDKGLLRSDNGAASAKAARRTK